MKRFFAATVVAIVAVAAGAAVHAEARAGGGAPARAADTGVATAGVATAGVATAGVAGVGVVPPALQVPDAQTLATAAHAIGVQIYVCQADVNDSSRFVWVFKSPEADLFDRTGKKIGRHYAGPTWEAGDGSKVIGRVAAQDDGPDRQAIPWLLLTAKSNVGEGVFGRTRSIQRLHTAGGKPPADGCTSDRIAHEVRVPYTADYYFYDAAS